MKKSIIILVGMLFVFWSPQGAAQCSSGTTEIVVKITTKNYGNEVYWKIKQSNGPTIDSVTSGTYQSNAVRYDTICLANNVRYTFEAWDVWGDGWDGGTYEVLSGSNVIINNGAKSPSDGINQNGVDTIESSEKFMVSVNKLPDVALYEITRPILSNCGTGSYDISAKVKVVDSIPVDTIFINYKVDGGNTVSESFGFSSALTQNAIVHLNFSKKALVSSFGKHTVSVWTDLPMDSVIANDSATTSFWVDSSKTHFPILQDFENESLCGNTASTCIPDGNCPLNGIWKNFSGDDSEWSINKGATESNGTGPNRDHTLGNASGKYLFLEASACQQKEAILQANCLDLAQMSNPNLYFWYHMYGSGTGNLYIEIDTNGTWITLDSLIGEQQLSSSAPWRYRIIDLSNFQTDVNIRLRGVTGNSFNGDIALDDILIKDFPSKDLFISEIIQPDSASCGDSAAQVQVVIGNLGLDTVIKASVRLEVSGDLNTVNTLSYSGLLPFCAQDTITFSNLNLYAGGNLSLKAIANLTGDLNSQNDTLSSITSIVRFPTSISVSDTGVCGNGSLQLISASAIGDSSNWYSDPQGLTLLSTSDTLSTGYLNSDTSFYFRSFALANPNCATPVQSVSISVNRGIQSSVQTTAKGIFTSSKVLGMDHDTLVENDTLFYNIQVPNGYVQSDYGITWKVSEVKVATSSGTKLSNTSFDAADTIAPVLSIMPVSNDVDSLFETAFTITDLRSGCDTLLTRKLFILAAPSASFSADSVCLGAPTSFSNSSSIASGGLSYLWIFGDGDSSFLKAPNHTYVQHGNYTVLLYTTSVFGIVDNSMQSIVVHPQPQAGFSAANVCSYDSATFTNTSTIASGNLSHSWNLGDGTTLQQTSPQHLYADTGSFSVQLISQSAFGCTDTITKALSIYQAPISGFSAVNTCLYDTLVFTDTSSFATSFRWTLGNGSTSTLTSPRHLYDSAGTYSIQQIAYNDHCSDTTQRLIDVLTVPEIDISVQNQCLYDSVVVINRSLHADQYSWMWGDQETSSKGNHRYSADGNYTITLTARTLLGCQTQDSLHVTVFPIPIAKFSVKDVCYGDSAQFINASSITSGLIGAKWTFGDATTSNSVSPKHLYDSSSTYPVQLITTSSHGCSDTVLQNVTVNALPEVQFSTGLVCTGLENSFINQSTGATSYKWHFGNGDSSSLVAPRYTYTNAGNFQVQLLAYSKEGCVASIDSTINAYQSPKAILAINEVCEGDSTLFSNYSSNSDSQLWKFGDNSTSNAFQPSKIYTSAGTYKVTLIASTTAGCIDSTSKSASVLVRPTAQFSVNKSCFGDSSRFSNSSSHAQKLTWTFGDGFSSTDTEPVHHYSKSGNYLATLVAETNQSCSDTFSQQVTVYPRPKVSMALPSSICTDVVFTAQNNTSGASSYIWSFGNGSSSTSAQPNFSYSMADTHWVSLIASSTDGCIDVDSAQIKIHQSPKALFSIQPICLGDTAFFQNQSQNASTVLWNFGKVSTNQINPSYYFNSSGNYSVALVATTVQGCKDTITKTIEVKASPVVSFSIPGSICQKDSFSVINNTSGANTYVWSFGENSTSSLQAPDFAFDSAGIFKVHLQATSGSNCTLRDSAQITVHPTPASSFIQQGVCLGSTSSFQNTSSIASGSLNHQWSFGDLKGTSTKKEPEYQYGNSGSFDVKLISQSTFGCKDSAVLSHTVYQVPKSSFYSDTVCLSDSTTFVNQSKKGTTFKWIFGNDTAYTSQAKYTFKTSGSHFVSLATISDKGCSDTLSKNVQVLSLPKPLFTVNHQCAGDSNVFTNFSSNASTYQWNLGDGTSSTSNSIKHLYKNPGSFDVTLTATSLEGCSDSISHSVSIYTNPLADFTSHDTCLTDSIFFQNNSQKADTYVWSFDDGTTSTLSDPRHLYKTANVYSVQLVAKTSNGCSDTAFQEVNVFPLPSASFSVQNVCYGDTAYISNTSTGMDTSIWSLGNGMGSKAINPQHFYSAAGTYSISLLAKTSRGCIDSSRASIVVYNKPTATFGTNDVCIDDSSQFNNLSTGASSYKWTLGDGNSNTLTSLKHLYASSGSYSIQLIAFNTKGCSDTASHTVTVHPKPVVHFGALNVCEGDSTAFTNNTTGAASYQWKFGDGTKSSKTSLSHMYTSSGSFLASLLATTAQGCTDSTLRQVDVYKKPQVQAVVPVSACLNDSISLKSTIKDAASIQWSFGNGNTSVQNNPTLSYAKDSNFQIKLLALSVNGCRDSVLNSITIFTKPQVSFSYNNICLGDSAAFVNNSAGATSYQWSFGDQTSSKDSSVKHYYTRSDNYPVQLTAISKNGCIDSLTQNILVQETPQADFSVDRACEGKPSVFTNLTISNADSISYRWNFGDGGTENSPEPIHQFSLADTFAVELVAFSNLNCADTLVKKVIVGETPKTGFSSTLACIGDPFLAIDTNLHNSTPKLQTWIIEGKDSLFGDSLHYVFNEVGNHSLKLQVLSNQGCKAQTQIDVFVGAKPSSRFLSDLQACEGEEIDFLDVSTVLGAQNLSYQWSFGDGSIDSIQDPIHAFNDSGKVRVRQVVRTDFGCADSSSRTITIHPAPEVSINWEEVGAYVYFSPGDTTLASYQWDFGNGATSRFPKDRNWYHKNGEYFINLIAETDKGCATELNEIISLTQTGISNETLGKAISVTAYPNPFQDQLQIVLTNITNEHTQLSLLSSNGKTLHKFPMAGLLENSRYMLSTELLAPGSYYLRFVTPNGTKTLPLVKVR